MVEATQNSKVMAPGVVGLLAGVHLRSAWRRLKATREQSRLLTSVIALFIASYLVLAYWLFRVGLRFVSHFPGLGPVLVERLLFLLFAFLFLLLLISNLVISYTNLFRNPETYFLLTLPVRPQSVFRWKFVESTLLASWAFVFLVTPLLAAYGVTQGVAWHFYPVTFGLLGLFIILPGLAGAWLALIVARYLDRRVFRWLAWGGVVLILMLAAWWFQPDVVPQDPDETRMTVLLDKVLFRTRFAQFAWMPSYWLSCGVLHWSEGAIWSAAFFTLVMASYVAFFGMMALTRTGRLFYEAASAVQSRGGLIEGWSLKGLLKPRRSDQAHGVERLLAWCPGLAPEVRALVAKDMRLFWRDTSQWAQSLMLFGLLGFYIFNLRHFSQQLSNPFWVHLVSYLNLGACSLNLATLTTRFVYPQFSLEGRRLWIVGLAPVGLARILRIKFWLAALTSWAITLGLTWLSCHMLEMPWARTLYFALAITIMTFTLTGLAVGLGALYPNLKEDNPSKIVSGFGGAFCLVLSFLYILGSVLLLAFSSPWLTPSAHVLTQGLGCLGGFLLFSLVLGWVPLQLGLRQVNRFEW